MAVKRKPKSKRKPTGVQVIVATLSENGAPRRRAEIHWSSSRRITFADVAKFRDCGKWVLPPGWIIRITNAPSQAQHAMEDDHGAQR